MQCLVSRTKIAGTPFRRDADEKALHNRALCIDMQKGAGTPFWCIPAEKALL